MNTARSKSLRTASRKSARPGRRRVSVAGASRPREVVNEGFPRRIPDGAVSRSVPSRSSTSSGFTLYGLGVGVRKQAARTAASPLRCRRSAASWLSNELSWLRQCAGQSMLVVGAVIILPSSGDMLQDGSDRREARLSCRLTLCALSKGCFEIELSIRLL